MNHNETLQERLDRLKNIDIKSYNGNSDEHAFHVGQIVTLEEVIPILNKLQPDTEDISVWVTFWLNNNNLW